MISRAKSLRALSRVWPLVIVVALSQCLSGVELMAAERSPVRLERVPHGAIQPVARLSADGTIHLIYFVGDPRAGDVFYVKRRRGESTFLEPVRVNSQPGSVIAIGTVRGAHLALGPPGTIHVAWMGSSEAQPRGPHGEAPMLYARSSDGGRSFEPERNVVTHAYGLDGGGTVAADVQGNVSLVWHAGAGREGEDQRRVWLARSSNGGATFEPEVAISGAGTGVCGCCGLSAAVDAAGALYILYRGAWQGDDRAMYLLRGQAFERRFTHTLLERWRIAACPMSTSAAAPTSNGIAIGWETDGEVAWAVVNDHAQTSIRPIHPPHPGDHRKHPAVAMALNGSVLFVWTEGTGWNRGGSLHWQEFDSAGRPTDVHGNVEGVPTWSRASVVADADGYMIIY